MTTLSVLALENIAVLRALNVHEPIPSISELARRIERDQSNVTKSLTKLEAEGLCDKAALQLTDAGLDQVRAIGRAEGGRDEMLPKGWALLRHDQIAPDPNNPRKAFDEADLRELGASIAVKGLLQNPLVSAEPGPDGRRQLRAGERRWRAIGMLIKSGEWPEARQILCQLREGSAEDALADALIENLQRLDINPMDEAEAYLKLADGGMSPAQIEALVGTRGKRSVEQYIFVGRKASAEQKADIRAGRLGINVALRDLQEHKAKPKLDISPRDALALAEVAQKAMLEPVTLGLEPSWTRLWTPPTGGSLVRLHEKKLILLRAHDGGVYAKVSVAHELGAEWLTEIGFRANPDIAVHQLRVKALGELETASLQPDADRYHWATLELRRSVREEPQERLDHEPHEPHEQASAESGGPRDGREVREVRGSDVGASPQPAPLQPDPPELTAAERLILIEIAHKIGRRGVRNTAGEPACHVFGFRDDPLCQRLIIELRMLKIVPGPVSTLVACLTPRALEWFRDQPFSADGDGLPVIRTLDRQEAADDAGRTDDFEALDDGQYLTAWLNDAATEGAVEPERTAFAAAAAITPPSNTHQSDLGRQILALGAEQRALQQSCATLRHAETIISRAVTRKLSTAEADEALRLIAGALEAAKPFLHDEAA